MNIEKTWYGLLFKQKNFYIDVSMMFLGALFLGLMANLSISASFLYDLLLQLRIPVTPVPITMQTFGVFALAFFFGARKAGVSLAIYILLGIAGVGLFSNHGSGLAKFLGPSGGYIVGFLFAAIIVGYMIEKGYGRNLKSVLLCLLVGEVVIYAFGLPWLWLALPELTLWGLLMAGLIPFIIGDALKMLGAGLLFPYLWKGAERVNQAE